MLQDYQPLQSLLYICGTMVCLMMITEAVIGTLVLLYLVGIPRGSRLVAQQWAECGLFGLIKAFRPQKCWHYVLKSLALPKFDPCRHTYMYM